MRFDKLLVIICFLNIIFPKYFAEEIILINQPISVNDKRYDYSFNLLSKVLETTEEEFGKARIKQSDYRMLRTRTLVEMQLGEKIHVIAEAVKPEWEDRLIPIRIPIRKGIQGYRLFLIDKKNQGILSKVEDLDDLKKFSTGSGTQWSTTRVLNENGFEVVTDLNYEGLFRLLMNGTFTTFGRGINEIFKEYDLRKKEFPNLAIEQDLVLYIPLPTYFYITPTKKELAQRIEKGLLMLIEDGTFDKFFNDNFGEMIKKANLSKRKIFKINNPNLSDKTPLDVEKYWYRP